MTSYQMPQGLLADPYAGAFGPQSGLLADPAALQQFVQSPQGQGLLGMIAGTGGGARNMGNDMRPGTVGATPPGPGTPIPNAPPGAKPGAAGGPAGTQPMQPMLAANAAPGAGPQAPTHMIPSGHALPISPKVALSDIARLFAPGASPEGKLPPMGLGGLRRMYASPETLAAEAEAAKAQPATAAETGRPGVTWDSGAGEGASNDDGSASQGGGGHSQPDGATGEGAIYRRGGYIREDGDGKLEPRRVTAHEGEVVINPEAVRMLGKDKLVEANRRALAMKRKPMGLLG